MTYRTNRIPAVRPEFFWEVKVLVSVSYAELCLSQIKILKLCTLALRGYGTLQAFINRKEEV